MEDSQIKAAPDIQAIVLAFSSHTAWIELAIMGIDQGQKRLFFFVFWHPLFHCIPINSFITLTESRSCCSRLSDYDTRPSDYADDCAESLQQGAPPTQHVRLLFEKANLSMSGKEQIVVNGWDVFWMGLTLPWVAKLMTRAQPRL